MKDHEVVDSRPLQLNKKWHQLKQKQQIVISTLLRDYYIKFVLENNRKPNKNEKKFIVATIYLDLEEKQIFISDNELSKYFESKIANYDKSIEKAGLGPENLHPHI